MQKIRVGIIGLGFMGTTHFRIYQDVIPDAQVVAVADIDPAKQSGDISKVWGNIGTADNSVPLDFSGMGVYASGLELIADPQVEVVDICVPTPFHKDLIVAALRAGKHVFSEKPLCRNWEQACEIRQAVEASDKFFNVGMCVRAWPEYRHAWETFHAGRVGKLRAATFRRFSPSVAGGGWQNWFCKKELSGGALLDMHLHDTDQVIYFFGLPQAVTAIGADAIISESGIDHVSTFYHYGDGTAVSAQGCWGSAKGTPFEAGFQLVCEKATIRLGSEGYKIYWNDGHCETPHLEINDLPTGWHQELKYFIQCVRDNVKPDKYQNLASIMDSFKVILAEQKSIDCGERVAVQ